MPTNPLVSRSPGIAPHASRPRPPLALRYRLAYDATLADPQSEAQPLLAELAAASVQGRAASGPRAGLRPRRLGDRVDPESLAEVTEGLAAFEDSNQSERSTQSNALVQQRHGNRSPEVRPSTHPPNGWRF